MSEQNLIIEKIGLYISQQKLSRARFSEITGVGESTLNKVLSGHMQASTAFKLKVKLKTGLLLDPEPVRPFDFHLRSYIRSEVSHVEGLYQSIRPSYRSPTGIHGYVTKISWSEAHACLIFEEIDNDMSPKNSGYVSIPLYNRMMYFITCDKGNFRLSVVSDAYQDGIYYGAVLTVGSQKMSDKVPTAATFVIKKISKMQEAVFGVIEQKHGRFKEFYDLLKYGLDEGFFRTVILPDQI